MSAAAAVLSIVQARAEYVPVLRAQASEPFQGLPPFAFTAPAMPEPVPQFAFYRKYTEAMLRRYVRYSLEVGRVPSLLGRELFQAKVTSYRMESFEDAVIFCHDVERCMQRLKPGERYIVDRMALKRYTILETAELHKTEPRTIIRRYCRAIDHLTAIFLEVKLLEFQKSCQAPKTVENSATLCNQTEYKFRRNDI